MLTTTPRETPYPIGQDGLESNGNEGGDATFSRTGDLFIPTASQVDKMSWMNIKHTERQKKPKKTE